MPELSADDIARVLRAADRDEIRQLAYRYAWGLDSRDIDSVAELYAPEAESGQGTGTGAWRERFRGSMGAVGVTILFVGNHLIEFDGPDEASGVVYCRGYIETRDGPHPGRFVEQAILYRDRYRRVEGAWKFVSRSHELWFGIETAERPLHQRAADWPLHHDGVGTVPYGEPTWGRFWADRGGYGR